MAARRIATVLTHGLVAFKACDAGIAKADGIPTVQDQQTITPLRALRAAGSSNPERPSSQPPPADNMRPRQPVVDFPTGFEVSDSAARLAECPLDADWVVVGGGAAGCAAAAALAEEGLEVLLLERGPSDKEVPTTASGWDWPKVVNDASQAMRFKEGVWGAVANVLGGGTSLNAALFLADTAEFFREQFPDLNVDAMMESYEILKMELAHPLAPTNFSQTWNDTLNQSGFGFASSEPELEWTPNKPYLAYSTFDTSKEDLPRYGAATLIHNREHLENLRVFTGALVNKILIDVDTKEAYGVEVTVGDGPSRRVCNHVGARAGVILSAGAIFTPQLLQISGVGPRDLLEQLGVPLILDLPVGANFVDRNVQMIAPLDPQFVPFQTGYAVVVDTEMNFTIENTGGGAVSVELAKSTAALVAPELRTQKLKDDLTTVLNLLPEEIQYLINNMNQFVGLHTNTFSRGWVNATSTYSGDIPDIAANYYADRRDWVNFHSLFHKFVDMIDVQAMAGHVWDRLSFPFPDALLDIIYAVNPSLASIFGCFLKIDDNHEYPHVTLPCLPSPFFDPTAVEKYLWDITLSSYHYFGTASVGTVTEGRTLNVKGTSNLHVVDASVFPRPTNVNPQASIMALGYTIGRQLAQDSL